MREDFEHYKCAGTKPALKNDIAEKLAKFICSNCLSNNPMMGKAICGSNIPQIEHEIQNTIVPELEEIVLIEDNEPESDENYECDHCEYKSSSYQEITVHVKKHKKEVSCNKCSASFVCNDNLDEHIKSNHMEIGCDKCNYKTTSEVDLNNHTRNQHAETELKCDNCIFTTKSTVELEAHIIDKHSNPSKVQCEMCNILVEDIETHKANVHTSENFKCTQCDFTSTDKDITKSHINGHEQRSVAGDAVLAENDIDKVKRELRALTDNYERLSVLHSKLKDETNVKLLKYKMELDEAQENFRVAQAKNEKLRETNDIQNKLWKIWLKENTKETNNTETAHVDAEVIVETKEGEEESDDSEEEAEFIGNKHRGFKRTNPAASAEARKNDPKIAPKNAAKKAPSNAPKNPPRFRQAPPPAPTTQPASSNATNKRYCHFWNNVGKCTFQNCKFLHEKAPVCKFDGNCNRAKCMFSHVKQNVSFLVKGRQSSPPQPSASTWGPWSAPWNQPSAPWGQPSTPWGLPPAWGSPWGYNVNQRMQKGGNHPSQ